LGSSFLLNTSKSRCPSLLRKMACSTLMVPNLLPEAFVVAGVAELGAAGNGEAAVPVWAKAATEITNAAAVRIRTSLLVMGLLWTPWKFVLEIAKILFNSNAGPSPKANQTDPHKTAEFRPDYPAWHATTGRNHHWYTAQAQVWIYLLL
jgi:hypothetical protein